MLITKLYLGAMSRADVSDRVLKDLPNFYLFVDEFQNFANESFADILSEARKYKLNLTIAHQYIEQMTEEVKAAVFGNVGSMFTFRVGAYDAEVLEKEFAPVFTMEDIVNLDKFQIYLRLMIDGVGSQPFSARTINNPPVPEQNFVSEIIDTSRSQFARPRAVVEEEIKNWHRPIDEVEGEKRPARENSNNGYGNKGKFAAPQEGRAPRPGNFQRGEFKRSEKTDFQPRENTNRPSENGINNRRENNNSTQNQTHNPFKKAPVQGTSEEREKAHIERELELRKAISLNFLKKDEPKENEISGEKKDKKGVTQESLSDLRSALKSVLSEAGITPQNKGLNNQDKTQVQPEQVQSVKRVEQAQKENSTQQNDQAVQGLKNTYQKTSMKEIPEKELRDLLSIE